MTNQQKVLIGAALIAVWGGFAIAGMTPVDGYVSMLRDILVGLGILHVATGGGKQ